MYCMLVSAGTIRTVTRVTSLDQCIGAASTPTGNPANGTLLVLEPSDLPQNPFWLSTADGVTVSAMVATVWCIAWALRATRRSLN